MPNLEHLILSFMDRSILEVDKELDLNHLNKNYPENQVPKVFFQNLQARYDSLEQTQAIKTLRLYGKVVNLSIMHNAFKYWAKPDGDELKTTFLPLSHELLEDVIGESNILAYRFSRMYIFAINNPPKFSSLRINYEFKLEDLHDASRASQVFSKKIADGIHSDEFWKLYTNVCYGLPYLNIPREVGDTIAQLYKHNKI